jgi:hypothetical protein
MKPRLQTGSAIDSMQVIVTNTLVAAAAAAAAAAVAAAVAVAVAEQGKMLALHQRPNWAVGGSYHEELGLSARMPQLGPDIFPKQSRWMEYFQMQLQCLYDSSSQRTGPLFQRSRSMLE